MLDTKINLKEKKLSWKERKKLPDSAFVFPDERKYPIHDISHARNALARIAQYGTPDEIAKVKKAVYAKYPELKPEESIKEDVKIGTEDIGCFVKIDINSVKNYDDTPSYISMVKKAIKNAENNMPYISDVEDDFVYVRAWKFDILGDVKIPKKAIIMKKRLNETSMKRIIKGGKIVGILTEDGKIRLNEKKDSSNYTTVLLYSKATKNDKYPQAHITYDLNGIYTLFYFPDKWAENSKTETFKTFEKALMTAKNKYNMEFDSSDINKFKDAIMKFMGF